MPPVARSPSKKAPAKEPRAPVAKKAVAKKAVAKKAVAKKTKAELPVRSFAKTEAFAEWLAEHHASSPGLWLKLAKKGSGHASTTYPEALLVALAWGWIDGQKGSLDAEWWLQKFTPRGARSIWSQINRDKAEALVAEGLMKPPGLAQMNRAKADGRWAAAYASQRTVEVPPDLREALDADPKASKLFASLDSANRYAVLFRVHTAKKPETRAARIAKLVAMLSRGEKIHS